MLLSLFSVHCWVEFSKMSKTYQPAGLEVRQSHNIFLSSHIPPPINKITLQLIYLGHFCNYRILKAISWVIITADGSFEQINSCRALPHKITGFSKLNDFTLNTIIRNTSQKFPKQELCKNTRTANLCHFWWSALLKEKDIGARKIKKTNILQ